MTLHCSVTPGARLRMPRCVVQRARRSARTQILQEYDATKTPPIAVNRTTQVFVNLNNSNWRLDKNLFVPFGVVLGADGMKTFDNIFAGYGQEPDQVCRWRACLTSRDRLSAHALALGSYLFARLPLPFRKLSPPVLHQRWYRTPPPPPSLHHHLHSSHTPQLTYSQRCLGPNLRSLSSSFHRVHRSSHSAHSGPPLSIPPLQLLHPRRRGQTRPMARKTCARVPLPSSAPHFQLLTPLCTVLNLSLLSW